MREVIRQLQACGGRTSELRCPAEDSCPCPPLSAAVLGLGCTVGCLAAVILAVSASALLPLVRLWLVGELSLVFCSPAAEVLDGFGPGAVVAV
jgi:hypothetical protein